MRNNLVAARKTKKMRQQEVADLLGIERATYANLERGTRKPSAQKMLKLCHILEQPAEILFPDLTPDGAKPASPVIAEVKPPRDPSQRRFPPLNIFQHRDGDQG